MIRAKIRLAFVAGVVLALTGCADLGEGPVGSGPWAIYLLSDPALTSYGVRGEALADLQLAAVPFISIQDVRHYYWETHEIEFTPAMESLLDTMAVRGGSLQGVPFVVVVGSERIYLGAFWWAYSSMLPCCPYMDVFPGGPWKIQLNPLHQGLDPRADLRIYHALKSAGVLIGR